MLVLSRADVRDLLDPDALVDAVARAMADLSAGHVSSPPRVAATVPDRDAWLGAMPAHVPASGTLMAKLVSVFPHNTTVGTHQALVVAFDPETGTPAAVMDGTEITAARTAACSALSARLLAREDSTVLAILGTGVQARAHALAVSRVRPFAQLRIAGRDRAKAQALADELEGTAPVVRAAASWAEAQDGADVVCAATHPHDPVVRGAWLAPGTHVTSVGYDPGGREVDDAAIAAALVVVESREHALAAPPAGSPDLNAALAAGAIGADHVHAEIGEMVAGTHPGRTSADQLTLYVSVGVAAQDAAAAALVLDEARRRGVGQTVVL